MTPSGCEPFDRWCALQNAVPIPAMPAAVAHFVRNIAPMGIDTVWQYVGEISRAHYLVGLADPTLGGAVSAAINEIANIDPPRSWPAAMKLRFATLPYDMQVYVASHERERDREVRRAQNAAGEAKHKLAKVMNGDQTAAA